MKHRLKHIVEYVLLRGLLAIVRIMPLRAALALGWLIGLFFFHVLRYRRVKADQRLIEVFGDRFSTKERRRIAWVSFRNICFNAFEAAHFSKQTLADIEASPFQPDIEKMQAYHREHGGFIFATAHMGNWDFAGLACHLSGLPIFSIARRQKNPLTDEMLNQMRGTTGMDVILNDSRALKNIIRRLKAGEIFALLPDVRSRTEALQIDFLGGKANLGAGAALFARQANCPIFPAILRRVGWTQMESTLFDPIRPDHSVDKAEDWQRMLQELMTLLDAEIRKTPEQYFWFNKRWVLDPIHVAAANKSE